MKKLGYDRIAVLLGGDSPERAISLKSGQAVVEALQTLGHKPVAIDLKGLPLEKANLTTYDKVFIALHGASGENGKVQGFLEMLGVPYTGSGPLASALAMDKLRSKWIWQAQGLPVVPCWTTTNPIASIACIPPEALDHIGFPLIVKPNSGGSSLGLSKVTAMDQLPSALQTGLVYDNTVLVEPFLAGAEYTVGILGEQLLPPIRIESQEGLYNYTAKYHSSTTQYHCPSGLSEHQVAELQQLALAAYKLLDCRGWGRVDFKMDEAGVSHLLEVNTVPGLTSNSLVPMAAKAAGFSFPELIAEILDPTITP